MVTFSLIIFMVNDFNIFLATGVSVSVCSEEIGTTKRF